jgi:hypothetical protein
MWKEILETKIIRVEGLTSSSLMAQVLVSNEQTEQLDPYNEDRAFQLPLKTKVQLVIKSKSLFERFSVSFNTSLIVEDGVHWLPLFKDKQPDNLSSFPDEVLSPRLLVLLHKKVSLDVIKEGGEKSEVGSACEEDYMPEIKLCSSFIENHIDSPFEESFEENNQEIPNINIVEEVNQELSKNFEKVELLLEIEKKKTESLEKELETVKNAFGIELQEAKKRENDLLEEFKAAEARCASSKFEITRLKHEVKSLQSENSRLSSCVQNLEQKNIQQVEELQKKVEIYEKSHSNSDNILTRLAEFTGSGSSEIVKEKEEAIQKLTDEINLIKSKSGIFNKNTVKVDELEDAVQKFVKRHKLTTPIVKDREQVYVLGNKKISLCTKDSLLLYRVGAVLKPLEEFFFAQSTNRVRPHEDEVRSRGSPIRKSVKSLHSGSKSPRRSSYT